MIQTERMQLSYGWRRSYILAAKCLVTAAFLIVMPNSSFAGDPPGGDPPGHAVSTRRVAQLDVPLRRGDRRFRARGRL